MNALECNLVSSKIFIILKTGDNKNENPVTHVIFIYVFLNGQV